MQLGFRHSRRREGSHRLLLRQRRQRARRLRRQRQTPHPLGSQSLLQMTCGRGSSRSIVRIKSALGQFLSRIRPLVLALKAHKISVAATDLEKISLKATILSEVYGRIGGDWDPKKLARALRLRFSNAATMGDYDEHPEDLVKETDCIGEIVLALGGMESINPDETFSTPSDNPVPQDGTRPVPSLLGVEGAAKTPRLDSGLPHPLLAGDRTAGDSSMRARLAALEMEREALKPGSEAGPAASQART